MLLVVIVIAVIAAAASSKDKATPVASSGNNEANVPVHTTGKVAGSFQSASDCFGCGDLVRYVRTDHVWCAWRGSDVLIHVRFTNTSVEKLTVQWHPSYSIARGGQHATGLSQVQSTALDPQSTVDAVATDAPATVPDGSPIGACIPAFFVVDSG